MKDFRVGLCYFSLFASVHFVFFLVTFRSTCFFWLDDDFQECGCFWALGRFVLLKVQYFLKMHYSVN